ncbi:MAG: hypothetical protein Q8Q01_02765 [archaeon]|nr:hypothetical protein [archaeon]
MNPYKILVTGVGISGKSNLAKKLEENLSKLFNPIVNKDVDWDHDALIVPEEAIVYILQTPKGCQAERRHGISLADFNRIVYCNPDLETYAKLLASRGCAWFKEGVIEKGLDENPTPYSFEKLPNIIERIAEYALRKERLKNEDIDYFTNAGLIGRVTFLKPVIVNSTLLSFEGYDNNLEQLIGEINLWMR